MTEDQNQDKNQDQDLDTSPDWETRDYRTTDVPVLIALFRDAVRTNAVASYSSEQIEAWLSAAEDEAAFSQMLGDAWVRGRDERERHDCRFWRNQPTWPDRHALHRSSLCATGCRYRLAR